MTKCDFCVNFDPSDGCGFKAWGARQSDCCEQAITRMENALRNIGVAKND